MISLFADDEDWSFLRPVLPSVTTLQRNLEGRHVALPSLPMMHVHVCAMSRLI